MNNWNTLNELAEEPTPISAEADKLRQATNLKIRKLVEARAEYDATRERLAAKPVTKLTADDVEAANALKVARIGLLKDEALIRTTLAEKWYPKRLEERGAARDRAWAALEEAERTLREKLVGIGFPAEMNVPAMFNAHPSIVQAREDHRAAESRVHSRDDVNVNDQQLEKITAAIESAFRAAMAVA